MNSIELLGDIAANYFPIVCQKTFQIFEAKAKDKAARAKKLKMARRIILNELKFNSAILEHALPKRENGKLSVEQAQVLTSLLQTTVMESVFLSDDDLGLFDDTGLTATEEELLDSKTVEKKTSCEASTAEIASFIIRKTTEAKALAKISIKMPRQVRWSCRLKNLQEAYLKLIVVLESKGRMT